MRDMRGLPRPEYPRPSFRRRDWVNLNGDWDFGADESRNFDRRILVPFSPQSQLSGIGERVPGDVLWYRHRFDAPDSKRLLLHFGAVDYRATVWVNGEEVAAHEGGHTPFSADISRFAGRHDNVLVVRAEDPFADLTIPRGKQYWKQTSEEIFYTPTSGIWQTVWLEPLPERFIRELVIRPDLDAAAIDIEVSASGGVDVVVTLSGEAVGRWRGSDEGRIQLSRVMPWSPEAPHLYEVDVSMLDGTDRVVTYFGLRKLETKDGTLCLNGAPYIHRLVLDQGYFLDGLLTAPTDGDLRRDIELAKSMGFNGARKHQKIEDPRWLYWADILGFLVWSEMPNFHERSPEAERRLTSEWREAVMRDAHHPSIVAWVPV
ncbi:MAG TPA: glycoside hydrolase family 2, partial [Candidatus Dormibacteraeota bacterium]|nr:glycoside hydrolase family 2 [Candidatus Dormibacteraeota bacterium]